MDLLYELRAIMKIAPLIYGFSLSIPACVDHVAPGGPANDSEAHAGRFTDPVEKPGGSARRSHGSADETAAKAVRPKSMVPALVESGRPSTAVFTSGTERPGLLNVDPERRYTIDQMIAAAGGIRELDAPCKCILLIRNGTTQSVRREHWNEEFGKFQPLQQGDKIVFERTGTLAPKAR